MSETPHFPVLLSVFFAKKYNAHQDISIILAQTYLGLSRNGMKIREDQLTSGSAHYSFDHRYDAKLMIAIVKERIGALPTGRKYLGTFQYRIRAPAPEPKKSLEAVVNSNPEPISLKEGSLSEYIGE